MKHAIRVDVARNHQAHSSSAGVMLNGYTLPEHNTAAVEGRVAQVHIDPAAWENTAVAMAHAAAWQRLPHDDQKTRNQAAVSWLRELADALEARS